MNKQENLELIAGPCSVESREQLHRTAKQLVDLNITYFRGGVWKPRSRPGTFIGLGEEALGLMQEVKVAHGLKTITEVATAKQVEQALKFDIDAVWVGARSTVNPFYVQEIANALRGVEIPVFVKNPINPDFSLWLGAIERFEAVGIQKISAIHRGFSTASKSRYRNKPFWTLALQLKALRKDIPMICDPSHIAGKRSLIAEVSQYALDLQFDGLMIETHSNPDIALSDRDQQITPERLKEILDKLIVRQENLDDGSKNVIHTLREEIDEIDRNLVEQLSARMRISKQIGEMKSIHNISVLQPDRWQKILAMAIARVQEDKVSKDLIRQVFAAIHEASIETQIQVIRKDSNV